MRQLVMFVVRVARSFRRMRLMRGKSIVLYNIGENLRFLMEVVEWFGFGRACARWQTTMIGRV